MQSSISSPGITQSRVCVPEVKFGLDSCFWVHLGDHKWAEWLSVIFWKSSWACGSWLFRVHSLQGHIFNPRLYLWPELMSFSWLCLSSIISFGAPLWDVLTILVWCGSFCCTEVAGLIVGVIMGCNMCTSVIEKVWVIDKMTETKAGTWDDRSKATSSCLWKIQVPVNIWGLIWNSDLLCFHITSRATPSTSHISTTPETFLKIAPNLLEAEMNKPNLLPFSDHICSPKCGSKPVPAQG